MYCVYQNVGLCLIKVSGRVYAINSTIVSTECFMLKLLKTTSLKEYINHIYHCLIYYTQLQSY